jgi:hypothetical protein
MRKSHWYENVSFSDGSCLKSRVRKNAEENSEHKPDELVENLQISNK